MDTTERTTKMDNETMTTELVRYDAMCRAIDEALKVDEAKDVRDYAMAAALYFRQAKNHDAERKAMTIRVRAERKAGELLHAMEKATGARGNPGGQGAPIVRSPDTTAQKTLADLGVSKQQSSDWQRLADVPKAEFETSLASLEMPSAQGIIGQQPLTGLEAAMAEGKRLADNLRDTSKLMTAVNSMIANKVELVRQWDDANAATQREVKRSFQCDPKWQAFFKEHKLSGFQAYVTLCRGQISEEKFGGETRVDWFRTHVFGGIYNAVMNPPDEDGDEVEETL
jgi:hypothetical protein